MIATTPHRTIILADAQYLIRFALRRLIEQRNGEEQVLEAKSEAQLLAHLENQINPLVILDYLQPGSFSLDSITKVREKRPDAQILVISTDHEKGTIYKALELGVHAFLTKYCEAAEILDAIEATNRNERFYCSTVIDCLLEKSFPRSEASCNPVNLSQREIEIVQLTAQGLLAKEIAEALNLSTHTVYTHRKNIMQKLKVKNASELVLYAVNKGWVDRD